MERDRGVDAKLRALGWVVLRYWTHDDVEEIADEIEDTWRDVVGLAPLLRE